MLLTELTVEDKAWLKRIGKKQLKFPKRISLLVGPNGSGKSSTLALIQKLIDQKEKGKGLRGSQKCETYFLDTERTFRERKGYLDDNPMLQLAMRKISHGEAMSVYWQSIKRQKNPAVFLIDEPETGADHWCLMDLVKTIVESEHQFIISTHSPLLWFIKDADLIVFGNDPEYPKSCMDDLQLAFG